MKTHTAPALQSQTIPDRPTLRARLEATRSEFHRQVEAASGDEWNRKSPTCNWTVGEVLVHLTSALEFLPKEVEMARRGKGMFNQPKWLADPVSFWLTRWEARRSDPDSLVRRYDAAMNAVIAAVDTVPDSDWGLGAHFYGAGFYTVADLFETAGQHLADHTRQP